ncbi:hypothetical protein LPC08_21095 [Roseomonas sp. OT10]|uniref:hypothetical protein n=1 Tax=Roseomonas cutis TaxID=2897332 RepID=UPI001E5D2C0C|nr:hypothetical protein [Roseomonas sp. OT10]UFN48484.1 hypothetical protein LPC08_21095 [Roseomonas sp. OT10]
MARRLGSRWAKAVSAVMFLLWSFVGSLALGLCTPATSEPVLAPLWLGVAVAIGLLGLTIGVLTDPRRDR